MGVGVDSFASTDGVLDHRRDPSIETVAHDLELAALTAEQVDALRPGGSLLREK
jgi:hypothetical protein